jgi:hypothetical protein
MDRRRASEPARGGQRIEYAAGIASAESERGRIELTAEWILSVFDDFYDEFLRLTWAPDRDRQCAQTPGPVQRHGLSAGR